MEESKYCPCCGRHCDLNQPHCERGEEYARTGVIVEGMHHHNKKNFHNMKDYDTLDIDNKLIINLRDLAHGMRFLYEGKGSQKRILIILNEAGSMTQRELTEKLGIQPGSASEVIGKLESAGLIQRSLSEKDRRTTDIQLTEAGRLQAEEAAEKRKLRHEKMFACLSDEEKNILLEFTERLNKNWESIYRESDKGFGHHHIHGRDKHCHGHHKHQDAF